MSASRPQGHLLGLLGLPTNLAGKIAQAIFDELGRWVAAGAASLISELGQVIDTTTANPLGRGFYVVLPVMERIGAALALPFLLLATIQAIVRQDFSQLLRTVLLRAPIALIAGGAAIEAVALSIQATDALSRALLAAAGGPERTLFSSVASSLATPAVGGPGLAGAAGVLLAILAGLAAFILWLELVIREAAVSVAALFLPIALAALIWPATAHWARRLGETIAALILAKLAIAAVLALGVVTLGEAAGPGEVVEGIALLVLSAGAPFAVLRLLPAFENGAIGHLDGLSRRPLRGGQQAAASVGTMLGSGEALPNESEPIEMHPGSGDPPVYEEFLAKFHEELNLSGEDVVSRSPSPNPAESDTSPGLMPSDPTPTLGSDGDGGDDA